MVAFVNVIYLRVVKVWNNENNQYLPYQWTEIFTRLIGSYNVEYPWISTVLRTERKMARRFMKVSEEEIVAINEAAFFYLSDLVNTKY